MSTIPDHRIKDRDQDTPPRVSVVIPAYRVSDYIAETIRSVANQTYRDFEVIVINDCCPDSDRLETVLEPFRDLIRYIRHDANRGVSAARNTGILAARGEWIAFLDGDDLWEPCYLAVQMEMIASNPGASLVYGNARIIGSADDGKLTQTSRGPVTVVSLLRETVSIALLNMTLRSKLLEAGLFDESFRRCEDFDLWLRIVKSGGVVIYHSKVIAQYRRRDGSLTGNSIKMYEDRLRVFQKLESDSALTNDERLALKEAEVRCRAQLDLEAGQRALAAGHDLTALRHIKAANEYFRKPKLRLIETMIKHCPELLRFCFRFRRRLLGY